MRLPPPCDEDFGLLANRPDQRFGDGNDEGEALPALQHYEHAIKALAGTTYSGLSSPERRKLLASLCREKQRLGEEGGRGADRT